MRKHWYDYYLELAEVTATRGTCKRLQVGAIIVKNKRIVSTGYNGSIHGEPHCIDEGCLLNDEGRCIRTLHAEENAILHANREDLIGATVYCTHEPCERCTKMLAQVGIAKVVFSHPYENKYNKHFNRNMKWIYYRREES